MMHLFLILTACDAPESTAALPTAALPTAALPTASPVEAAAAGASLPASETQPAEVAPTAALPEPAAPEAALPEPAAPEAAVPEAAAPEPPVKHTPEPAPEPVVQTAAPPEPAAPEPAAAVEEPAVEPAPAALHAPFDAILKATVRSERIRYQDIRSTHRAALGDYLDTLATIDAAALPRSERLAFYINAYNATMITAIADRYRPGYSVSEGDWGIFDEPLVRLHTGTISLNDLEHRLVRPMGDPRIHAALVCGAVSCPPLIKTAYTADNLSATLTRNTRRWINDPDRNTIDAEGEALVLSAIFDWYADDFGGKDGLAAYIDRYTETDVSGFSVTFREYDWSLNDR